MTTKPVIDSAAIKHWVSLQDDPSITSDGKYFSYMINNQPLRGETLIVASTEDTWKKELLGIRRGFFSGNSRQFIFQHSDTLFFLDLGTNNIYSVLHVSAVNKPWGDTDNPYTNIQWVFQSAPCAGRDIPLCEGGHGFGIENKTAKIQWIDRYIEWIKGD